MKDYKLEVWGEMCPLPLLKVQRKIKEIKSGDSITLETEHSCTSRAVAQWAKEKNYEFEEEEIVNGIWRLRIIKK